MDEGAFFSGDDNMQNQILNAREGAYPEISAQTQGSGQSLQKAKRLRRGLLSAKQI